MTIQETTQMLSKEASVTLLSDMLKQAEEHVASLSKLLDETTNALAVRQTKNAQLLKALRLYVKLDNDNRAGCNITEEDWGECWNAAQRAIAATS